MDEDSKHAASRKYRHDSHQAMKSAVPKRDTDNRFVGNPGDRGEVLERAMALTYGDRDREYGPVVDNMKGIARLWQAYLDSVCIGKTQSDMSFTLTAEDVAHMMVLLKVQRTANAPYIVHHDNHVDMAAYSAIAGECSHQVRHGDDDEPDKMPG